MPDPLLARQLADRQEIMAVMAAYARWADLNQPERQAATFAADGRVSYHPGEWTAGREALTDKLRTALAGYAQTSHHVSNVEIDFEGPDTAAAQSAVILASPLRRVRVDPVRPVRRSLDPDRSGLAAGRTRAARGGRRRPGRP